MVRRRARGPQRTVEGKSVAVRQLEALGEHHLEDVAGADVLERAPHRRLELPLASGDRNRLGQPTAALASEEPRAQRERRRRAQRIERPLAGAQGQPLLAAAHVAVTAERALEEEGVVFLLLVEKTKDAERRQQITGKLYRSKACS